MTVLVTGATGHIGANLVRALADAGRPVRALVHRDGRALEGMPVERVSGDVRDPASLARAVGGSETVFHLAARITIGGDPAAEVRAVNVEGTRNVVEACLRHGVRRLVHFASIHALSAHPAGEMVDEARPPAGPDAPLYDQTKAEGLGAVLEGVGRGLNAVALMPTAVIGPADLAPSRMGQVLLDVYHGRLPALVEGGFDWVDVRDVVAGALAAERRGTRGGRYILSGRWLSLEGLAALVARVRGARPPGLVCPMWLARAAAPLALGWSRLSGTRPIFTPAALHALRNHRHVSHERAVRELGWEPRPLEETIADTFEWFGRAELLRPRWPGPNGLPRWGK